MPKKAQHPGQGPEKLQDHAGDERGYSREEQPGMSLSEAIHLVHLVGMLGHVGEGRVVFVECPYLGDSDTAGWHS